MDSAPTHSLIYGIDDDPGPVQSVSLGLQHYLTMFGATITIPLIMIGALGIEKPAEQAQLIATMFFVSGITTLLQTTWGNRLPIVQGGTFSLLTPALTIAGMASLQEAGWQVKMTHIQGAIIAGGAVEAIVGFSGLMGVLVRFVGPITIAPTIALIGLSLFGLGAPWAGEHWGIGGLTIGLIILCALYLRRAGRVFELYPILLGIVGAWGTAWYLSHTGTFAKGHAAFVDVSKLDAAPWLILPLPFQWGTPQFTGAAVVGMLAGFLASMIESVGDYFACARISGAPEPDAKTINRGIGIEGVGCMIAGVFGTGNGTTSYSENIGAIGLTRVGSRRVVQAGAVLMIVMAVFGKFGGLFTTIPKPVVGGLFCAMFGMIAAVGLSNLQRVDMNSTRNLFIIGFAFYMGLSLPVYFNVPANAVDLMAWEAPGQLAPGLIAWLDGSVGRDGWAGVVDLLSDIVNTLGKTGMAVGALAALILDNTVPGTREERGLA